MQMPRQHLQRLFQLSAADPLLESAVAGLVRRIFLRQFAPLRSGAQHPEHAVQHGPRIVPRAAAVVLTPCGRSTGSISAHCSSVSSQRPVMVRAEITEQPQDRTLTARRDL